MRRMVTALLLLSVLSCGKPDKVPDGVLPPAKMQEVLWDMIQADEFLRNYVIHRDTLDDDTLSSMKVYDRVFQLHGTSRPEFDSSYNYYRRHTLLLKEILDTLSKRGQADAGAPTRKIQDADGSLPWPGQDTVLPRLRKQIPLE